MESPFLVALAVLERDGKRAMPLGGRSSPLGPESDAAPGEAGLQLALELLLRLFHSSDSAPWRRAAGDDSLLLLEMPLMEMTERLPSIKASWISGGDTTTLLRELQELAPRGWFLRQNRKDPLIIQPWRQGSGSAQEEAAD